MSPLTPRQAEAVEAIDENVFVAAGAGTGKTRVLVGRYLELLRRRRATVYRIVAVTYTEKAAKEIKDRIRQTCQDFEGSAKKDEDKRFWYAQRIALENGCIGTIHSLCAMILRMCPVEVGIDPRFSVLDETQSRLLRRKAVDEALSKLLDDDNVDAIELMRVYGRAGTGELMHALLGNRPRATLAARKFAENPRKLSEAFLEVIASGGQQAVEGFRSNSEVDKAFSALADRFARDPSDKLELKRVRLLKLRDQFIAASTTDEGLALLWEMKAGRGGRLGSKTKWDETDLEAVRAAVKRLNELLGDLPEPTDETFHEKLSEEMKTGRRVAAVYHAVDRSYEVAKAQGCFLDFDDLLMKTCEFLMTNAVGRARLQKKFDYLLVDELQDTSYLERDILCLLCASRAENDKPEEVQPKPGKLFVVGDDKQSIYGFRGSDVTVFSDFRERIAGCGRVVELDRSFRSTHEGVAFANELFSRLMPGRADHCAFQSVYHRVEPTRGSAGAFAELLVAQLGDDELMASRRSAEAALIADRIERMVLDEEVQVARSEGPTSPVRYGDMVILFQALTQARTYEEALRDAGIPYYLLAGSGFYAAQEIRDVLNCLRTLERQADGIALFGTLRSPMFGLSDDVLYLMSRSGSINEALEHPERIDDLSEPEHRQVEVAGEALALLRRDKNRMGIAELIQEVIERTGFDAVVLGQFMGHQKLANLEKLIDQARSFEGAAAFTLDDFLDYMDEFVRSEAREGQRSAQEEAENVVRLMTIHRAKGLEFPVVFVADMSRQPLGSRGNLLVDGEFGFGLKPTGCSARDAGPMFRHLHQQAGLRESAEDLRLLYVALTRAQDRLVMCGAQGGKRRGDRDWLSLMLRTLDVDELRQGDRITLGSDCQIDVRTETTGAVVSQESEAAQAGWLGAQRLERVAADESEPEAMPKEMTMRVGPLVPAFKAKRRFTVSELLTYRNCPRQYHCEHILGLSHEAETGPERARSSLGGLIGTVVHRVLALWDLHDETTLTEHVARAVAELPAVGRAQSDIIAQEAQIIVTRAAEAELLAPLLKGVRVEVERAFCLRCGTNLVEGVIDRLTVFEDGRCEVIDYKTNRVDATGLERAAEPYRFQVGVYALAASEAVGPVREGSVLFLSPGKWVRWELNESALTEVCQELSRCIEGIQAGDFDANEASCHRCGYGYVCEHGEAKGSAVVSLEL